MLSKPFQPKVEVFEACALPFGAAAAVHGFTRCALALNHTAHHVIAAPCFHYFDDFTFIVPRALREKLAEIATRVFDMFGWKTKAEKEKPMSEVIVALGVESDLRGTPTSESCFRVRNK